MLTPVNFYPLTRVSINRLVTRVTPSTVLYQMCHFTSKRLNEKWHNWYSTALFLYQAFFLNFCDQLPFRALQERNRVIHLDVSSLCVSSSVPDAERSLSVGEFVEYSAVAADAYARGETPGEGWVHGLQGWPLMCEARQRGAEELLAAR